jgi:hypothetical protein
VFSDRKQRIFSREYQICKCLNGIGRFSFEMARGVGKRYGRAYPLAKAMKALSKRGMHKPPLTALNEKQRQVLSLLRLPGWTPIHTKLSPLKAVWFQNRLAFDITAARLVTDTIPTAPGYVNAKLV